MNFESTCNKAIFECSISSKLSVFLEHCLEKIFYKLQEHILNEQLQTLFSVHKLVNNNFEQYLRAFFFLEQWLQSLKITRSASSQYQKSTYLFFFGCKSALRNGQCMTLILCILNHIFVDLDPWEEVLFCSPRDMQLSFPSKSCSGINLNNFLIAVEILSLLQMTKNVCPINPKPIQVIIDPPYCYLLKKTSQLAS